jgi:diadenosine tetraphosphate (Ap4A) HIT family hydrolase
MTHDPNCIFCKITAGAIPSEIIWQDENHLAFLDIFPLRKAQAVVIPKDHLPSSIFALSDGAYIGLMAAAKKVSMLIEEKLGAERTMVVGEGLEIDHVHLKLYPRFRHEHGIVSGGPQADFGELKNLADTIRG